MASTGAFQVQGNTVGFTAAQPAPTAVQLAGAGSSAPLQAVVTNMGSVTVFVVWGATAALAATNAATVAAASPIGSGGQSMAVLPGSQITMTLPAASYITGVSATASSNVVMATPGEGL